MKKYDIYAGIFWTGVSIYLMATAIFSLGLGNPKTPGPGFFPLIVGFILLAFGIAAILVAIRERKDAKDFNRWPAFGKNIFIYSAVLLGYSFVFEYLGFILSSFLLLFYLFLFPGKRTLLFSLLFSLAVVTATYYTFGVLLQAQFPEGVFGIG